MFQRLDNFPRKTNEYFSICTNICVWLYDIIQDIALIETNSSWDIKDIRPKAIDIK